MINSELKKKFKKKNKIFAHWITKFDLLSLEIVLKANVYDCFVVDMEHSSISLSELEKIIILVDAHKKPSLVRIEKIDKIYISKPLDFGASGIIAPNVNTEHDIDLLINSILYPPFGKRGVGLSRANNHGQKFKDYYKKFNNSVVIIPMIENITALKNLEKISSSKKIDCLMIGPYDLSASMKIAGNFDTRIFKNAIKNILDISKKNRLGCGIHIVNTKKVNLKSLIKQGYNFFPFSTDVQIFIDGLIEKIKIIKKR